METKKFISGLGQSKEITNFLQNENLTDFAIFNLSRNEKDGTITFTTATDFHKIETLTLDLAGQKAFELFGQFKTSKNAIACLLKALEDKKPVDDSTFKNQSKLTPATYGAEEKALNSFSTFYAYLTPERKTQLEQIASDWMKGAGLSTTMTEFFFINGDNDLNLKAKQLIRLYDPIYGQHIYSMVFMASPQGVVTCIDDESVFSLSAESAKTIELIDNKKAPAEVLEFFTKTYAEYIEECEERKTDKLEKAIKLDNFRKEQAKKQAEIEEKKAVSKKALEEKAKKSEIEKAKIEKLAMTTKEEIEAVVKMIEKKEELLTPAHRRSLMDVVKAHKASLRAKRTTQTPVTEVPAEVAPANVPSAKPTRQRRASAPQQPTTIAQIIEEDAKSENPILA